jgi:hypothetical protein
MAVVNEQGENLAFSKPIGSTVTDGKVTWPDGQGTMNLSGRETRLKFELNNAKLYAFQLQSL